MNLHDLQGKVDESINEFGGYWAPLEMFAALVEEVGELGRELNDLYGPKHKKKETSGLKLELGDVLYALTCIANKEGINMEEALINSLNKNLKRDKNRFKKKN
ncbi:MAG: nucleotide pyrophosphohydrolase [Candidatus Nanoarchaeia archaeon]|jgi:NTP pyrophosphatase (non-canonical NTP hydrolase)